MEKTILKSCDLPIRVGLDKISVKMPIVKVDWKEFDRNLHRKSGLSAKSCRELKDKIFICDCDDPGHWVSWVGLKLRHYSIIIKSKKSAEAEIEATIPTISGFEELGNIHNLSCDEMKSHIRVLIGKAREYGIYLDDSHSIIQTAEINLNLYDVGYSELGEDFEAVIKLVAPLITGQNTNAVAYGVKKAQNDICTIEVQGKSMDFSVQRSVTQTFSTDNGGIKTLIYDKSEETQKSSKGLIHKISTNITRVEFKAAGKDFGPYMDETDLFNLSQADIENAFRKLVLKQIKLPFKKICDKWDRIFEELFSAMDIAKNPQKWKDNICEILNRLTKNIGYQLIITKDELSRYVSYMQGDSVSKNRARLTNDLTREIGKLCLNVIITDKDYVNSFLEKLCSISGEEKKTIVYEVKTLSSDAEE